MLKNVAPLVRTLRPSTRLWYDVIGPLAMVVAMVGAHIPWAPVAAVVIAVVLFHGGQTLFNDVADVAVDRASTEPSRTERATVTGQLSRRLLLRVGWIMVVLSLGFALLASWVSFLVLLAALPTVLSYNFVSMGGLSARPVATQVFWPVTWIMIYLLCAGALGFDQWRAGLWYLVFVMVFMGLGEGLCQDIRDVDNDEAGGRVTTVVRYGPERASLWAWTSFAASAVPLVLFTQRFGAATIIICLGVLGLWLILSFRFTANIRSGRRDGYGKAMHVGSIATYTAINVVLITSALSTT